VRPLWADLGLYIRFMIIWCGGFENPFYAVIVAVILGIKPASFCVPVIGSRVATPL
jgi:hypothetical protein